MNQNELYAAIRNKTLSGVYLFEGPEEYIKRDALEKMRAMLLPAGLEALNETVLTGVDIGRIIESAETLPMMCDQRFVMVKECEAFLNGRSDVSEEDAQRFRQWLSRPVPTCVTVFYLHGMPDKRKRLTKLLMEQACVVDFNLLEEAELRKWISQRLKQYGKTIGANAVNSLIFLAGQELARLSGEVDKLAAYAQEEKEITPQHVSALVAPSVESNVFMMVDALVDKQPDKAYAILNAMLDAGEDCMYILAMITRQMRLMTHIKRMREEKSPLPEIVRRLGQKEFVVRRIFNQCARFRMDKLEEGYRQSAETEFAVKSGLLRDRAALDKMMLALIAIS